LRRERWEVVKGGVSSVDFKRSEYEQGVRKQSPMLLHEYARVDVYEHA
jgi:hypothetical protein